MTPTLQATVRITKVPGHATAQDVIAGRFTAFDKFGNDNADALAVSGALLHHLNQGRDETFATVKAAMDVQRMMVDIVVMRE